MSTVLLHPSYFPDLAHFVAMLQYDAIIFEVCDNYQKQTYRNRTSIYGANGKLDLNIPVIHTQKNRQLFKDVEIFTSEDWQQQHLKSIESAYKNSPFFEFYIDDLIHLFQEPQTNLMDFNLKCLSSIFECFNLKFNYSFSSEYQINPVDETDGRSLVNAKRKIHQDFDRYAQVFEQKHGFLSNLSILDLLFNQGPSSEIYLKAQYLNI